MSSKFTAESINVESNVKEVVFLDFETTGLDSSLNNKNKDKIPEIIEIGAIKVTPYGVHKFQTLIKPRNTVPLKIYRLCKGLKEEELMNAPEFYEVKDEFIKFIEKYPLVCHNAKFEYNFFKHYFNISESRDRFIDSMEFFAIINPWYENYNLDYLIKNYLKEDRDESHRAYEDSLDTLKVVNKLVEEVKGDLLTTFEIVNLIGEGCRKWVGWLKT